MNEDEIRLHTPVVISCNDGRREVTAVQNIANKQIDRTFVFDKVISAFCFFFVYFSVRSFDCTNCLMK